MTRRIRFVALGALAAACVFPTSARPEPPAAAAPTNPAADPDDAEKLFRRMEARFVKAPTLVVSCDSTFEGTFRGKLKGSLICGTGNQSREQIEGELALGPDAKKVVQMRMISDGTKMATTTAIGSDPQTQILDTTTNLGAAQRLFTARAGVVCPIFLLAEHVRPGEKPPERKPEDHIRVGDFRLGQVEKVGGQDTRVLHYSLTGRTFKEPLAVTVWLHVKTDLPLKRVIVVKQEPLDVTVTESYAKLSLDEKIDGKRFELPKE